MGIIFHLLIIHQKILLVIMYIYKKSKPIIALKYCSCSQLVPESANQSDESMEFSGCSDSTQIKQGLQFVHRESAEKRQCSTSWSCCVRD